MKPNDIVIFLGCIEEQINWGQCDNPNTILEQGQKYVVECVDVHRMHTKIKLVGYDGWFNSVCFETNE